MDSTSPATQQTSKATAALINYTYAQSDEELQQILDLQRLNHFSNLEANEKESQGFVSVLHDMPLLKAICPPYHHVIAKHDDTLAGFALVMLREHQESIPLLKPMFEEINAITYKGKQLKDTSYYIMGQVCIAKAYRGLGVFDGLYYALREQTSTDFEYLITEISAHNLRSQKAHARVGFKTIKEYTSEADHKDWQVVLWDWK